MFSSYGVHAILQILICLALESSAFWGTYTYIEKMQYMGFGTKTRTFGSSAFWGTYT